MALVFFVIIFSILFASITNLEDDSESTKAGTKLFLRIHPTVVAKVNTGVITSLPLGRLNNSWQSIKMKSPS